MGNFLKMSILICNELSQTHHLLINNIMLAFSVQMYNHARLSGRMYPQMVDPGVISVRVAL